MIQFMMSILESMRWPSFALGDDAKVLRAKMFQVLVKSSGHTFTDIIRELIAENTANKHVKLDEFATYGLEQFLWDGLAKIYGYPATSPTIDDFVLWMFSRAIEDFVTSSTCSPRSHRQRTPPTKSP